MSRFYVVLYTHPRPADPAPLPSGWSEGETEVGSRDFREKDRAIDFARRMVGQPTKYDGFSVVRARVSRATGGACDTLVAEFGLVLEHQHVPPPPYESDAAEWDA